MREETLAVIGEKLKMERKDSSSSPPQAGALICSTTLVRWLPNEGTESMRI
jgi:hypothetical protein